MSGTKPKPKNAFAKSLGARLRVEREAQGITLGDLASALGVAINTVRWHEAGSRLMRADELAAAAKWLRLDPPSLLVPHDPERAEDVVLRKKLGARMHKERSLAGKSQYAAITGTGVAIHEFQAHEAGERSLRGDQLVEIANKLGIPVERLMAV